MAGIGLPLEVISRQLRRGIDLVVHIERLGDGSRKVERLLEVPG
jgi:Flp pilus assembly CpaF family ATPase